MWTSNLASHVDLKTFVNPGLCSTLELLYMIFQCLAKTGPFD